MREPPGRLSRPGGSRIELTAGCRCPGCDGIAAAARKRRKPEVKLSSKSIRDTWARLRARLRGNPLAQQQYAGDAPPLRAELFSADQMERHGKTLAGSHRLSSQRAPDQLLARLALTAVVSRLQASNRTSLFSANRRISPAG